MINRLLIRVKVAQVVYSMLQNGTQRMYADEAFLESVDATRKLQDFLLTLIVNVTKYRREQLEAAKNKYMPTQDELHPNTRFVDNKLAKLIAENEDIMTRCEEEGLLSDFDTEMYRALMNAITAHPVYMQYMSQKEEPDFNQDKALWIEILNTIVPECNELYDVLEERNIYWNDDLTTALAFTVRQVEGIKPTTDVIRASKNFRNDDERRYAMDLYHYALDEADENMKLIDQNASNWEIERMPLLDKVIMCCALSEIRHFIDIPTAVSINEYVELAKHYCSFKSAKFINGVIDKIARQWKEEKVIVKG